MEGKEGGGRKVEEREGKGGEREGRGRGEGVYEGRRRGGREIEEREGKGGKGREGKWKVGR